MTLMVLFVWTGAAFGWGGTTHATLASRILDDPVIAPLIPGDCSVSTVKSWTSEPPDDWHHPGWAMIRDRGYLGTYSGQDWTSLTQTTRVKYLIHIATDCGVPVGHSPAAEIWSDTIKEAGLEFQVSTWPSGDYPSIVGTSSFTHSRNGYSKTFDGTRSQIMTKFHDTAINSAEWARDHLDIPLLDTSDYRAAGWNGTKLGQFLGRVMLADLFLAEQDTHAEANGSYSVNPGGLVSFSSSGSYDPDSITWNSSGSYSNNGGGFSCAWDLNNDGTYETSGANPNLSHSELVNLVGYTEGTTVRLRVADDEPSAYQSTAYDTATLAVYSNPTADAHGAYSVYEGGSVQFSGSGGDADGGSVSYAWDKDNNGTYETSGRTPTFAYGTWTPSETGHTVVLRVLDNEGQTQTDTATVRVYSNPTADTNGDYYVYEDDGLVQFSGSGGDADGGSVSYAWDRDNNGTYETSGRTPTFAYSTWTPSETGHTVVLRVLDNEGQTQTDTAVVRVYSNPTAAGRAQYGWLGKDGDVPSAWVWDNLIDDGSYDADGGNITTWAWDLNNNGTYDKTGSSSTTVYYSDFTAVGVTADENHTVTLRVTDNEGQTKTISGISMPILVNPTCDAGGSSSAYEGGASAYFSGSGSDPDGGSITQYRWDINNDGTWDIYTDSVTLSYDTLTNSGYLVPSETGHTVKFGVVDNDADITGWWAGEATDTTTLYIYSLPTAEALEQYILGPGESVAFAATGDDADGGGVTFDWDLDGDGQYDDLSGTGSLTYDYLRNVLGLAAGEWLEIELKVEDNEGQAAYDTAWLALYPSILGDADADGDVDLDDLGAFADAWGSTSADWSDGDFDLDGDIDLDDLGRLADNWGGTSADPPGNLPEPTTLGLLGAGAVIILRRRRKS